MFLIVATIPQKQGGFRATVIGKLLSDGDRNDSHDRQRAHTVANLAVSCESAIEKKCWFAVVMGRRRIGVLLAAMERRPAPPKIKPNALCSVEQTAFSLVKFPLLH
jgi:hypothetical protein